MGLATNKSFYWWLWEMISALGYLYMDMNELNMLIMTITYFMKSSEKVYCHYICITLSWCISSIHVHISFLPCDLSIYITAAQCEHAIIFIVNLQYACIICIFSNWNYSWLVIHKFVCKYTVKTFLYLWIETMLSLSDKIIFDAYVLKGKLINY